MMRILGSAAVVALLAAGPAAAELSLRILHTNDVHSRIEPINKYDSTCGAEDDAAGKCFGGSARLKTAIAERRAATNGPLLLLDAGDQFQGSLFYTTYKGKAAAELMNAMDYDAMAIGNHEFDDGPATLASFIDLLDAPVLKGNVVSSGGEMDGKGAASIIREFDGQNVGIIGVTATDSGLTSSPGKTISFADDLQTLRDEVAALEAQGVHNIIAITHVGLPRDREIAAQVAGIDVIVGGHSHSLLSNVENGAADVYPIMAKGPTGDPVAIVTAYAYGKYLGELDVTFSDEGRLTKAKGDPILLDAKFAPDATVAARVAELAAPIEELKKKVVAESVAAIDGSRDSCRSGECEMGVLVAEAMLDRLKANGAQIAIQNGGGLRASIDAGEVTMGEVLTVLPFQNTLSNFTLNGAQIRAALENGVSQVEEGAGRFPQVAGMRFSWDPTAAPGTRIVSVETAEGDGWAPLKDKADYAVVSNNFMRAGGDGYAAFTEARDAYDYGPGLEQVLADYLAAHAPYQPVTDGRILRVATPAETMVETPAPVAEAAAAAETVVQEVKEAAGAAAESVKQAAETVAETVGDAAANAGAAIESTVGAVAPVGQNAAAEAGVAHVVAKGESLWIIAREQLGDATRWKEIAILNDLSQPTDISIGQKLKLPNR